MKTLTLTQTKHEWTLDISSHITARLETGHRLATFSNRVMMYPTIAAAALQTAQSFMLDELDVEGDDETTVTLMRDLIAEMQAKREQVA